MYRKIIAAGEGSRKMMMLAALFVLIGATGSSPSVFGQCDEQREEAPFRYVFIENRAEIDEKSGKEDRVVEVLMDEAAFSEENLRILFRLISKRYEDATILSVTVHTSLEQAPTPEERDGGTASNRILTERDRKKLNHLRAIYIRTEISEFFRYSPRHDVYDIVTVELRPLEQ